MQKLKLLIAFTMLLSCNEEFNNKQDKIIEIENSSQATLKDQDKCKLDYNSQDSLIKNLKELIKWPDSCVIELMNGMKEKRYYRSLDSLYSISDGYISDYFIDIITELFYTDYKSLSAYLYSNQKSHLITLLIESLSVDISDSDNPINAKENILKIIKNDSENKNLLDFMLGIQKKVNPDLYN